ncbi:MAG: Gfo/Idh/MocA family oxidoreductase [Kiritimatiellia bacterium]|jgi:predicted dehydrogenase|nr:Gfo/Idh/MocA family oxidoreductase [Kiritimatiellia bacterium]MDP6811331.1 Gfo/Idh/MocA family oxidoreductase [Kiritimatiellia bacterium]MDP7024637.1 Gfo/Idh/MocA family oxidoreductase [Kiritimatiellia bacterium]
MRFIQVGVGGFGGMWVSALKNNRQAKVVGMVDLNPQAMQQVCDNNDYDPSICFPTLKQALQNVEADAVVVVTPPAYHRAPVVEALGAGLHVISEKPMAESMADCKAMFSAARKAKRHYVVSQNYRYADEMYTMADLIKKGRIGEIGQVKIDFYKGVGFDGFRAEMPYPLLVDMSIHHFDLIRFITGLDAVSVRGQAWNPTWSHFKGDCSSSICFTMANDARVLYNGSWCAKGDYCDWNGNWQIEGSKGTIRYEKGVITLDQVPEGYRTRKSTVIPPRKLRRTGQDYVLANFMKSIRKGERPLTDVYDNIYSVAMVFGAVKAVKGERRVSIIDPALQKLIGDFSG